MARDRMAPGDAGTAVVAAGEGTVAKALTVLDQVASFGRPVRFSELLAGSPFPKATLFRFLQTLTGLGLLSHDPDSGFYSLGVRLVRLAHAAWNQSSLAPIARPHIDALSAEVGETVHLAQLDGAHVLYVDKRNARVPIEMFAQAGKVGPAYCTGVGKAMLAFLPAPERERLLPLMSFHRFTANTITTPAALEVELAAVRAAGHAFDREEHEPGIICVAAPILSSAGRVMGALSVTSSTARTTLEALAGLAPVVEAVAGRIAGEAESWRFPDLNATQMRRTG
ncbi:MAG: IclR family transcriptional regulator [Rhodobacteraceae bacterium]|nr:IclR family transcriptional regulator [Paracoccaceae bacterium]